MRRTRLVVLVALAPLLLTACKDLPGPPSGTPAPTPSPSASPSPAPTPAPTPSPTPAPSPAPTPSALPAPPAPVCDGTRVRPGNDVLAVMAAGRPGQIYCLAAGVHRLSGPLSPRPGDTIQGEPGAVLNGAVVLDGWRRSGNGWFASGFLPEPYAGKGVCEDDRANPCRLAEQVFRGGTQLRRVLSAGQLGPGRFFADYQANRVWVGDDPAGAQLELSRTRTAIGGAASGVTVRGLVIEKFASEAQLGAVRFSGDDWRVEDNEIRFNHAAGVAAFGDRPRILGNNVHHNGQLGVKSDRITGALVEGNELAFNNTDGFWTVDWEAGGFKATRSSVVVRDNFVHDNNALGVWFDIDAHDVTIEGNRIADNAADGIRLELSFDAKVLGNEVTGNGHGLGTGRDGGTSLFYGGGINSNSSVNVEIARNTVTGNLNGIGLVRTNREQGGPRVRDLRGNVVHDNVITMRRGQTGLVENVGDPSYFTGKGNRFTGNSYRLADPGGTFFAWTDRTSTRAQWQAAGQDRDGTFE